MHRFLQSNPVLCARLPARAHVPRLFDRDLVEITRKLGSSTSIARLGRIEGAATDSRVPRAGKSSETRASPSTLFEQALNGMRRRYGWPACRGVSSQISSGRSW